MISWIADNWLAILIGWFALSLPFGIFMGRLLGAKHVRTDSNPPQYQPSLKHLNAALNRDNLADTGAVNSFNHEGNPHANS